MLQKRSGGIRGIVAGDIFRRLVARTMAQELHGAVEEAKFNSGGECVARVVRALTEVDPSNTMV